MPRTCTICQHEKRQEIDKDLVAGKSFRRIAECFGTSETALFRHKGSHLLATVTKAAERREERHGGSLLDQVEALTARSQTLLSAVFPEGRNGEKPAISPKDARDVSAVIKEVRENLRLTAQLTGQLKGDGATVNVGIGILNSPEWGRIASVVTEALRDEPTAQAKVAEALASLAKGTAVAVSTQ